MAAYFCLLLSVAVALAHGNYVIDPSVNYQIPNGYNSGGASGPRIVGGGLKHVFGVFAKCHNCICCDVRLGASAIISGNAVIGGNNNGNGQGCCGPNCNCRNSQSSGSSGSSGSSDYSTNGATGLRNTGAIGSQFVLSNNNQKPGHVFGTFRLQNNYQVAGANAPSVNGNSNNNGNRCGTPCKSKCACKPKACRPCPITPTTTTTTTTAPCVCAPEPCCDCCEPEPCCGTSTKTTAVYPTSPTGYVPGYPPGGDGNGVNEGASGSGASVTRITHGPHGSHGSQTLPTYSTGDVDFPTDAVNHPTYPSAPVNTVAAISAVSAVVALGATLIFVV